MVNGKNCDDNNNICFDSQFVSLATCACNCLERAGFNADRNRIAE